MSEAKEKQTQETIEDKETQETPIIFNLPPLDQKESEKTRMAILYGDIDQEKASELISALYYFRDTGKLSEETEELTTEVYDPFSLFISTWGGSALDMFAIYDTMRLIKEDCEINTIGMGKVMSAGVLLLAAGTKKQRKIGANCRVMLHGVVSGQQGHIQDLENEMEEARWIQKRYIKSLSEETEMSQKYIKKLMDRKINVYLDAKEAVELGIADEII
jgi:ATP-dependent Clp protease protease subunit